MRTFGFSRLSSRGAFASLALLAAACPAPKAGESDSADTGPGDDDGDGTTTGTVDDTLDGGGGPCQTDDDCNLFPGLETCDMATGTCVGCLEDADCVNSLTCNANQLCEGCTSADDCPLGTTCSGAVCTPSCSASQACPSGFECCGSDCVDIDADPNHCSGCGEACPDIADGAPGCVDSECTVGSCDENFLDCNGDLGDGCEVQGPSCTCSPEQVADCYSGDPTTRGQGPCLAGSQTCTDAGTWGPCMGEVLPGLEACANKVDDDCDGTVDEDEDLDGDGFTGCSGDCCDEAGENCSDPELVNPGAFEVDGNKVDDDCDGRIDNPLPACDAGLVSNTADALDYARAIDLCQFTVEHPDSQEETVWGVISNQFTLTSGAGTPSANARSIRDGFGTNNVNQFGDRLAVMSSGNAADATDTNPNFAAFQNGTDLVGTNNAAFPSDWYVANGSTLPNIDPCPVALNTVTGFDTSMMRMRVRVPTNANSFSVSMFFLSAEFPEYVCTQYNDFFIALVDSTSDMNPADKNIAIYNDGVQTYPVGVNITMAANGLFTQCTDGTIGQCPPALAGEPFMTTECTSVDGLAGTGFDNNATACSYTGDIGGGTGWLNMSGNVTPGEVMEIRFAIWDTSDAAWDSVVLLDNWQWSVTASEPGIKPG